MTHIPDVSRSYDLYRQAADLIPGRTQLISRRADQFAAGISPVYAQRAKGSRFVDVDENEYIDWVNAVGAIILGHADPVVDNAVIAAKGTTTRLRSSAVAANVPRGCNIRHTGP